MPILFVPFDDDGQIDEQGLRRLVQFEIAGGIDGLGINGFASEAYKLSEAERERTAAIVAEELDGRLPLIIGIGPGSTFTAVQQARLYAQYKPAALMTLPPTTMDNGPQALVEHYVALGDASPVPVMVQQSPHIPAYRHCELNASALAETARRSPNVCYFKIEGPGSAERIAELRPLVAERVGLFGGGGGVTLLDELEAGANGLLPGVGFNEYFIEVWALWQAGQREQARAILQQAEPLVQAVSGDGHEFSLHARKRLMQRLGLVASGCVRAPTVAVDETAITELFALVDGLGLRISRP